MECHAVTLSVFLEVFSCDINTFLKRAILVSCDDRRHLFSAKRIGKACSFCFNNDYLRIFRHVYTCKLCNAAARLTYRMSVRLAVLKKCISYFFKIFLIAYHISSVCLEFLDHVVIIVLTADDRLFSRADDAIVKCSACDDLRYSFLAVISFVYDTLHISCAYAQSRSSGAVCCSYHS